MSEGRISVEYSPAVQVCFNMLIYQDEHRESGSWSLLSGWHSGTRVVGHWLLHLARMPATASLCFCCFSGPFVEN